MLRFVGRCCFRCKHHRCSVLQSRENDASLLPPPAQFYPHRPLRHPAVPVFKDEKPCHAMGAALPRHNRVNDDDVADETFHNPMFKDEDRMDASLPRCNGDGGNVVANETVHNTMPEDEEPGGRDAPLPPHGGGGGGNGGDDGDGDGVDKQSRNRTLRARVVLAIGLIFEVCATLWAFQQAVWSGALDGDVECGSGTRLAKLYGSYIVEDRCEGPIDAEDFFSSNDIVYGYYSGSVWEDYVGCDNLTDTVAAASEFQKRCSCSEFWGVFDIGSCSWVALSNISDDICYAQGMITNISDGTFMYNLHPSFVTGDCWATNPTGTAALTIAALVVALCSQLLEAVVGFKYWKDTDKRTAVITLATSVFEALGVVTVSSVLLSLPGLFGVSDDTSYRMHVFFYLAWITIPIVVVGALAEVAVEFSDCAANRLPYLGAVGNGLIWLGAALLEIVVTSYLLWTGARIRDVVELLREAAGFIALELLGLVSMWIGRGLWTRAKLLSKSVKGPNGALLKRAVSLRFKG